MSLPAQSDIVFEIYAAPKTANRVVVDVIAHGECPTDRIVIKYLGRVLVLVLSQDGTFKVDGQTALEKVGPLRQ